MFYNINNIKSKLISNDFLICMYYYLLYNNICGYTRTNNLSFSK